MKYHYAYRDSQNERHDDVIVASSTEEAFKTLRASGVRPFFVELAPGVWNRIQSYGKRGVAIAVLVVAVLAALAVIFAQKREITESERSATAPMARHQIYGDPVLMSDLERTDYADVFVLAGERLLARYAQPGVVTLRAMRPAAGEADALAACLDAGIAVADNDSREVAELKRIVLGMKRELREYLSDGVGTPQTYLRRLVERLREESAIRSRIETELRGEIEQTGEIDAKRLREANDQLRALGLRPVSVETKE